MVIGVTGGIASGKTTVARMMARLGAAVVDADQIGRAVVEERPEVLQRLVAAFGKGVLTPSGALDRGKLGRIAFSSGADRDRLNAIVHPHLVRELKAQVERAVGQQPQRPVVVDAALLFEWMLRPSSADVLPHMDATVAVVADPAVQIARLAARGFTPEEARERMGAQLSADDKAARADYVLHNEGSLEELEEQVRTLWERIHRDLKDQLPA